MTRLRQRNTTVHVMREFILTLNPTRLTLQELWGIMNSVQRPTNRSNCQQEFREFQTLLRCKYKMANEIIHKRYEPNCVENNILRLVLDILKVEFVEDTEDVRFQVVQAMSGYYNSCDELLSPVSIDDMTLLCLQIN